jgi:hypothetical protein
MSLSPCCFHEQINTVLNRIHEWGEFDQHPMKRFFLTRIGSVASVPLEICAGVHALLRVNLVVVKGVLKIGATALLLVRPKSKTLLKRATTNLHLKNELLTLCKRISGLASTLFFGIFTPEINFRIHKKLKLAVDNLERKKQHELKIKLETELNAAQIEKERSERFNKFQAKRLAEQKEEERQHAIESRLAELLFA